MSKKALLKEFNTLKERYGKLIEQERLNGYEPRSYHYKFMSSKDDVRMLMCANQIGKTTCTIHEIFSAARGYRPWVETFLEKIQGKKRWRSTYYRSIHGEQSVKKEIYPWNVPIEEIQGLAKKNITIPSRVAIVGLDFTNNIAKALYPKFKEVVPISIYKTQYRQGKIPEITFWDNGSETHYFSCDQETSKFESGTWDEVFWDEPPTHDKYIAMRRGSMVKQATHSLTMTPLAEPWIYDELFLRSKQENSGITVSMAGIYDKEVDWITEEKKKQFESEVRRENPDAVESRIYGRFSHLSGRIIANYKEEIHMVTDEVRPFPGPSTRAGGAYPNVTFGMTVDPHDRKPWAIAWWWIDDKGEIVFFKEWPEEPFHEIKSSNRSVAQYIKLIHEIEEEMFSPWKNMGIDYGPFYRFLDPNAGPKINNVTRRRLCDELEDGGLPFDYRINDDLAEGHDAMRKGFAYDEETGMQPMVYVHKNCWNMHFMLMRYVWKEHKRSEMALSEKVDQRYKDFPDLIRYTIMANPIHIDASNAGPKSPDLKNMKLK